jgi:hypothetical protein
MIGFRLIGDGLAILLCILAFIDADMKVRIFILAYLVSSFALPNIFHSSLLSNICFFARIGLGVGCYIYLRYRGSLT